MKNQYDIVEEEMPVMLYAGGGDGGVHSRVPQDFEPSLHLQLMSGYWRQAPIGAAESRPTGDPTVETTPEACDTPEAWLKYRLG